MFFAFSIACLLMLITPITYTEKPIKPYEDKFLNIVLQYCDKNEINFPSSRVLVFDELDTNDYIAYCAKNPLKFSVIFDKGTWDSYNPEYRYQLVFHELSHCYLDQEHIDYNKHYMFPYMNKLSIDKVNQQLIEILKEKCTKWKR